MYASGHSSLGMNELLFSTRSSPMVSLLGKRLKVLARRRIYRIRLAKYIETTWRTPESPCKEEETLESVSIG
jgi:hypothetical protein